DQDKGYLVVSVQLPDSASLDRTVAVMDRIEKIARDTPGVAHTIDVPGQSSNCGMMYLVLTPVPERRSPALYSEAIASSLPGRLLAEIEQAQCLVFGAPAVEGLGSFGGFKLILEATGDVDLMELGAQTANFCEKGGQLPGFVGLFSSFRAATPQLFVDVDRVK